VGALDLISAEHLARVRTAVLRGHSLSSVVEWITENTYLRGERFSFKDHEFQLAILRDGAREKVVRKCSQIGLSELSARTVLALANILDSSTFIYTLPTATFAKTFAKTRLDPIVRTSPALSSALNVTADNTEIKQFGNSFVYVKGTVGASAAISVPADGVFNDEVDFSDQEVMSNYQSRLTHSPYKLKYKFSTPTVGGFGISAEFEASRRHWNMAKCYHCGEWFVPDYHKHVRVPGFTGDLREITKERLPRLAYQEAFVECPKCGGKPSLAPEHRQWVVENPDDNYEAHGYQIQPFDAPRIITPADLVVSSTKYERYVDFVNFALGLPAEDKESTLNREEIEHCYVPGTAPGFFTHVMGVDMGMLCHVIVSGVDAQGRMMTVHTEIVPLARIQERKAELAAQFRVSLTVMDSQPYTETLLRLQQIDSNLYGAVYVQSKDLSAYSVKKVDEEDAEEEGELELRQVNVNRNKAFDSLMYFIRSGSWLVLEDENKATLIAHLQDMKRVKDFTTDKEVTYVWRKSAKGNDHFHHALLYCWVAAQMRGVSFSSIALPSYVASFRVKQ